MLDILPRRNARLEGKPWLGLSLDVRCFSSSNSFVLRGPSLSRSFSMSGLEGGGGVRELFLLFLEMSFFVWAEYSLVSRSRPSSSFVRPPRSVVVDEEPREETVLWNWAPGTRELLIIIPGGNWNGGAIINGEKPENDKGWILYPYIVL